MASASMPEAQWWRKPLLYSAGSAGVLGATTLAGIVAGADMLVRARPSATEDDLLPDATVLTVERSPLDGWEVRVGFDAVGANSGYGAVITADGRMLVSPAVAEGDAFYRDAVSLPGVASLLLEPGMRASIVADPWVWADDPLARGASMVALSTPNGDLLATEAGSSQRAVVYVHGRGGNRSTGWWIAPTALDAGWRVALASYTNDLDAPHTGRYLLGGEWPDIAYVMEHLGEQGVTEVVLAGWSMGGNICASYLRARHVEPDQFASHPRVIGLVMDAPALEWSVVLRHAARSRRMPGHLVPAIMAFGQLVRRINWRDINHLADAEHLNLPILTMHGTDDDVVPHSISEELVARLESARLVSFEGAGHCRSVNTDPYRYLGEFRAFLDQVTAGR